MICKVCSSDSNVLFKAKVLNKYDIMYYKCSNCDFIQTENPYWLKEAYSNAITDLDIGLINRNIINQPYVEKLIMKMFRGTGIFLDYGGGYGMFVRLMRDRGLNFYRQDYFCENLFAKYFDIVDIKENTKFDLLCAFEVFEHLEDPNLELEKLLSLSDNILFSTELQPSEIKSISDWWYFVPETGQHISLYSEKSLQILAKKNQLNLYSFDGKYHLLTKKAINFKFSSCFEKSFCQKLIERLVKTSDNPKTLLFKDFDYVRKKSQSKL